jgi:hypothetical protein
MDCKDHMGHTDCKGEGMEVDILEDILEDMVEVGMGDTDDTALEMYHRISRQHTEDKVVGMEEDMEEDMDDEKNSLFHVSVVVVDENILVDCIVVSVVSEQRQLANLVPELGRLDEDVEPGEVVVGEFGVGGPGSASFRLRFWNSWFPHGDIISYEIPTWLFCSDIDPERGRQLLAVWDQLCS